MHVSGGIIIFVRQGLSFSELSTSSLYSIDPYSDYVGINNNSSLFSFPNIYTPLIRSSPTDGRTEFFSPSFLPSSRNRFISGALQLPLPHCDSKGTSDYVERKYLIGSSLLTSSPSMILTYLLFFITPPLTSTLLPPLSLSLARGRCFRTWVLITYRFFYLSLSPRSFAATNVPLHSIFRKLAGVTLPIILTLIVLLQRKTRIFLFSLLLLSLIL